MPAINTDGDDLPDIAELRAARDPNETGEGSVCGGGPTYGCGARIAPSHGVDMGGLGAALTAALALFVAARRRR